MLIKIELHWIFDYCILIWKTKKPVNCESLLWKSKSLQIFDRIYSNDHTLWNFNFNLSWICNEDVLTLANLEYTTFSFTTYKNIPLKNVFLIILHCPQNFLQEKAKINQHNSYERKLCETNKEAKCKLQFPRSFTFSSTTFSIII